MNFTHRPVQESDLEIISGFAVDEKELFFFYPKATFPLTPDQLRLSIESRRDSTVVEMNGEVTGFANFYQWEQRGYCSIGNVVISQSARGLGACRYLMQVMIALASENYQTKEVRIACFNENTAALLLYRSLGFLPFDVEQRKDKQGKRVALIHMRLPLLEDTKIRN